MRKLRLREVERLAQIYTSMENSDQARIQNQIYLVPKPVFSPYNHSSGEAVAGSPERWHLGFVSYLPSPLTLLGGPRSQALCSLPCTSESPVPAVTVPGTQRPQ